MPTIDTQPRQASQSFDARSLEKRYAFLAQCPDAAFDELVTLPIGTLEERVAGITEWRDSLLQGFLPSDDSWPPPHFAGPMRAALENLHLARFCRGNDDLVDELLNDIVAALARRSEAVDDEFHRRLQELADVERRKAEERRRLDAGAARLAEKWGAHLTGQGESWTLDEASVRRLREQAWVGMETWQAAADSELLDKWEELARVCTEIADVFGDLGMLLGRGWDLALGVIHHVGWREILALRKLVERVPEFRQIVQSLGRLQTPDDDESVAERVFKPIRRLEEELHEVVTPFVPQETKGVERSAELARMLPSEASMLGHPVLRLLWHARRAERALLTYRVEGVEIERTPVEREAMMEATAPRPQRGPILAVVDTSGSMHGLPETVAKALVLEALRTAHSERRRCRLYAFSGPGQTAEHELDLSPDGVGKLLEFLTVSFGGGSDPGTAIRRVFERLADGDWAKADVLIVSDGEWPAPQGVASALESAHDAGVRFHGVQIGNTGATGMAAICDPVHEFADWSKLGWSGPPAG